MDNTSFAPGNNSMNNSVPPLPQPSPVPPRRKIFTSHFLEIIGLFVVIALVSYLGIQYWQDKQLSEEYVPVYTPRAEATADWKTYTNTQLGIEFKYPSNLYDKSDQYSLVAFESTPLKLEMGGALPTDAGVKGKDYVTDGYRIFVTTSKKKDVNIDLTKSVEGDYSSTKIIVGGVTGYEISDLSGVTCGPSVYVDNPKDSTTYLRIGYCAQTDYPVNKLFDQILSTFKFTNSTQGMHCGGNIQNAPTCPTGYTCKLNVSLPDTGGSCVKDSAVCAQVITRAKNSQTGEIKDFPTPCDVPAGWTKV